MTDFAAIRKEFPILDQEIHGHPLVYLDSAATSQKPQCVIDAESDFYRTINAGVHRGAHELAARSTMAFEEARAKVARLVGANSAEGEEEIVVTSGATAGLNLLATAFGNASLGRGGEAARRFAVKPGDEIVVSKAVLLPFQELAVRTGATLKWFDLDSEGRILSNTADEVITERTKIVAVTHVGNTTGAITDIAPMVKRAHEVGAHIHAGMARRCHQVRRVAPARERHRQPRGARKEARKRLDADLLSGTCRRHPCRPTRTAPRHGRARRRCRCAAGTRLRTRHSRCTRTPAPATHSSRNSPGHGIRPGRARGC